MRRSSAACALVAMVLLGGCSLQKDSSDCVNDPGITQGGSRICTQPPPPQFSQLGQ